jgi:hypothetical protein
MGTGGTLPRARDASAAGKHHEIAVRHRWAAKQAALRGPRALKKLRLPPLDRRWRGLSDDAKLLLAVRAVDSFGGAPLAITLNLSPEIRFRAEANQDWFRRASCAP